MNFFFILKNTFYAAISVFVNKRKQILHTLKYLRWKKYELQRIKLFFVNVKTLSVSSGHESQVPPVDGKLVECFGLC
jgi:hypothetical protein